MFHWPKRPAAPPAPRDGDDSRATQGDSTDPSAQSGFSGGDLPEGDWRHLYGRLGSEAFERMVRAVEANEDMLRPFGRELDRELRQRNLKRNKRTRAHLAVTVWLSHPKLTSTPESFARSLRDLLDYVAKHELDECDDVRKQLIEESACLVTCAERVFLDIAKWSGRDHEGATLPQRVFGAIGVLKKRHREEDRLWQRVGREMERSKPPLAAWEGPGSKKHHAAAKAIGEALQLVLRLRKMAFHISGDASDPLQKAIDEFHMNVSKFFESVLSVVVAFALTARITSNTPVPLITQSELPPLSDDTNSSERRRGGRIWILAASTAVVVGGLAVAITQPQLLRHIERVWVQPGALAGAPAADGERSGRGVMARVDPAPAAGAKAVTAATVPTPMAPAGERGAAAEAQPGGESAPGDQPEQTGETSPAQPPELASELTPAEQLGPTSKIAPAGTPQRSALTVPEDRSPPANSPDQVDGAVGADVIEPGDSAGPRAAATFVDLAGPALETACAAHRHRHQGHEKEEGYLERLLVVEQRGGPGNEPWPRGRRTGDVSDDDVIDGMVEGTDRLVLLLSPPGAGKTWKSNAIAATQCEARPTFVVDLPSIYDDMGQVAAGAADAPVGRQLHSLGHADIERLLAKAFARSVNERMEGVEAHDRWVEAMWSEPWLAILNGIHRIPAADRRGLGPRLRKLMARWPKGRVLVTGTPQVFQQPIFYGLEPDCVYHLPALSCDEVDIVLKARTKRRGSDYAKVQSLLRRFRLDEKIEDGDYCEYSHIRSFDQLLVVLELAEKRVPPSTRAEWTERYLESVIKYAVAKLFSPQRDPLRPQGDYVKLLTELAKTWQPSGRVTMARCLEAAQEALFRALPPSRDAGRQVCEELLSLSLLDTIESQASPTSGSDVTRELANPTVVAYLEARALSQRAQVAHDVPEAEVCTSLVGLLPDEVTNRDVFTFLLTERAGELCLVELLRQACEKTFKTDESGRWLVFHEGLPSGAARIPLLETRAVKGAAQTNECIRELVHCLGDARCAADPDRRTMSLRSVRVAPPTYSPAAEDARPREPAEP